jgi:hypothetical protein
MEARKIDQSSNLGQNLFVRWSDKYHASPLEERVQLVRRDHVEWVVSSPVRIVEKTQVYLSGDWAMGNGIVRSCRREGATFLLTIAMTVDPSYLTPRQEFDPGVLALDDFLTEEEEAKILESLKDEIPCSVMVQRIKALWCSLRAIPSCFALTSIGLSCA